LKPDEQCPCGGGKRYADCCLRFDGRPYKTPAARTPALPATSYSHPQCYMRSTQDCGRQISREHFVSASVLSHLGGANVRLSGVPWLAADETKDLPISALASNILCKRHNEAFAPLDTMAGKFFGVLNSIHQDVLTGRRLSRRGDWYLFSGEELELWLLKTAIGLFNSGTAAKDREKLASRQSINEACYHVLQNGALRPPCGLYVEPIQLSNQTNQIQFQPASDKMKQRMVGLKVSYLSFAMSILFDQNATYGPDAANPKGYRPTYLMLRNAKRTHSVLLTWPLTTSTVLGVVRVSF